MCRAGASATIGPWIAPASPEQIERACESAPAARCTSACCDRCRRALDLRGACWHRTDPLTALPIASERAGDPPGDFRQSLEFEFERADVNRFVDLADGPQRVGVLSLGTGGRPADSPRYREMIEPAGGADELRAVFADDFGVWGCLTLFGNRRFSERDAALVASAVPAVTRAMRMAAAGERPRPAAHAPVVIVLDGGDRVIAADSRARDRLRLLGGDADALPGAFYVLAAQARIRRAASGSARDAAGAWVSIDATTLDDDPRGNLAIVVAPAPRESLLDGAFRARGLTGREREVAALAVRGRSTKAIALELSVSPWTVQDHLKHVFDKCDVNTRGALATLAATG